MSVRQKVRVMQLENLNSRIYYNGLNKEIWIECINYIRQRKKGRYVGIIISEDGMINVVGNKNAMEQKQTGC